MINPILASSSDSKQLSLTLKGAIIAVAPIVALVIKAAGGEISNDELEAIVNASTDIVVALGSMASLAMMAFGVIRKVYNSFK